MVERSFATNIPWIFMGLILVLFGLGVLNLYSASGVRQEDGLALQLFYQRQCLWGFIGLLCMIIMNLFDYRSLNHLAIPFMIFSLVLLAMVPIFGKTVSGARRWLDLGLFSVQPSELGKIAVLILSSKLLAKGQGPLKMRELLLVLAAGLPAALMVIVQPDLGSGVNILLILGGLILYRGVDFKILRVLIILIPAVLPAVWFLLHPYQQQRIKTFIDPSTDPKGSGYHIVQSKIAIGSGQIWGKGFLQGTQSQLRFLPEKHTDFAISVFAEEWGFAGVV